MSVVRLSANVALFDLDGVLVDSRSVVERTWRRWAGRHGVDADRLLRVAHGRRTSDTLAEIAPELAGAVEVAWLDQAELEDYEGIVAVAGAARLLDDLPRDRWAVVTSAGPELATRRLAAAGLPLPELLVSSDDVTEGKPAPDGYLLAAGRLGVTIDTCVVFEDTRPGVRAGRAAGARVVALATTTTRDALSEADLVVGDLRAVRVAERVGRLVLDVG